MESRFDAADSYFINEQLTHFDPKTRYELVPGIRGRFLIPKIEGVSPNLPAYKYTITKLRGSTKRTRGAGRDAPTGSVVKVDATHSIETFEHEAKWTIDAVRAARETGSDLSMDTMLAAMNSIEQDIDAALCSGITANGTTGLMNNADIVATAATGAWSGLTGDQIIADVGKTIQEAVAALGQAQLPGQNNMMFTQFSLYLPQATYTYISTKPRSATTDTTVLEYIRKFAELKGVAPWWRLDTAGASNAKKAVLVPALDNGMMNPLAGGALLPMDFERLPEQYAGRSVSIPCAGKCGGFVCPYPIAFRYLTGL